MVTVRLFAAAAAAYGSAQVTVPMPTPGTVADVESRLGEGNPDMVRVLSRCSLLRNEVSLGLLTSARSQAIADGDILDVLPPFAGG